MQALSNFIWRRVAVVVSRPAVADWLIARAHRTPYTPIRSRDGSEIYMWRGWLFNPYPDTHAGAVGRRAWWRDLVPSVRIHHIRMHDLDEHMHDHPWNARTIILRNWYEEERPGDIFNQGASWRTYHEGSDAVFAPREVDVRRAGYTGRLLFGEYHRISAIAEGGAWTMFITWRYQGTWGFKVFGKKVPYRQYLDERALRED